MTRYIVGDIHGAARTFERLLDHISFETSHDELYLVGDLVNNGPRSVEVIRRAMELEAIVTLGNHDLHMLAVACGAASMREKDTFQDVLNAPDSAHMIDWMHHQHLFYEGDGFAIVHAGLLPDWTLDEARQIAQEIEAELRGDDVKAFFTTMYGNKPRRMEDVSSRADRLRVGINAMTRMRALDKKSGALEFTFKGTLDEMPGDLEPWFERAHSRTKAPLPLYFGHWSALGLHHANGAMGAPIVCLDSGVTWGGHLTACDPDTGDIFSVPACDGEAAKR